MTTLLTPAYHQLLTTGLARWVPALMILLDHYDGIERALEPSEHPLKYLAGVFNQLRDTPMVDRERGFFDAVASMPLLYYRIAGDGRSWKPRTETLQQFEQHVSNVVIWQEWTPLFSRNEIINWLNVSLPVNSDVKICTA